MNGNPEPALKENLGIRREPPNPAAIAVASDHRDAIDARSASVPSPPFRDRMRYWVDNQFSKGTRALILWLGVLSLAIVFIAAGVVAAARIAPPEVESLSFHEAFWMSLMRTLDPGTMGGDQGWAFRVVMFLVTIGGIFIISTLIGVLSSGIEGRLEDLRKGRSRVIEKDHTVILGWGPQVFTIVSELVIANENVKNPCIVVLSERDKVEMEDLIRSRVGTLSNTRLVCRTGTPMDVSDLSLVSLETARSIIVLSPESDDPDSEVLKTVLAVTNHPDRVAGHRLHIVAEVQSEKNLESIRIVGKGEVQWIRVDDFVSRMIAQTCRQSGLSVVYTELLDFSGDEVYFFSHPSLVGKTYRQALFRFERNSVAGLLRSDGGFNMNPPHETVIQAGDRLAVIAEDDDKIYLPPHVQLRIDESCIGLEPEPESRPERTLIIGWNRRGFGVLRELDHYLPAGSRTTVFSRLDDQQRRYLTHELRLENQELTLEQGESTDRESLERLHPERFDHVIVLSYSDTLGVQQADARTLITLLHLRDIVEKYSCSVSIVSEMLDQRNCRLAEVTRADDFIVSDRMVSLMLTQVSECRHLNAFFTDLFDADGAEIYMKPARLYVRSGKPVNFYTVVEAASRRGETAIGYKLSAEKTGSEDPKNGVVLNPVKSDTVLLDERDMVIVIAEN
jgi:voltage-gated potassium channel Kch